MRQILASTACPPHSPPPGHYLPRLNSSNYMALSEGLSPSGCHCYNGNTACVDCVVVFVSYLLMLADSMSQLTLAIVAHVWDCSRAEEKQVGLQRYTSFKVYHDIKIYGVHLLIYFTEKKKRCLTENLSLFFQYFSKGRLFTGTSIKNVSIIVI